MKGEYRESDEVFERKFSEFVNILDSSKKTAVFTGAGVSTLSGIPDFRGKGGVYTHDYDGIDIFYRWAESVWYHLEDYEPNIVHYTLAKMEEKGMLPGGVFTQNIDFMHQRAGSRKVYELHGSARSAYCTNCNAYYTYEQIAPVVRSGDVPRCRSCGGLIKPDIVFYGESLSSDVLKRAEITFSQADLTLVLGSSLTVYPAAAFPQLTRYSGGKIVIVNAQPTSQDKNAVLTFTDLEQFFTALDHHISD